MTLYSSAFFYFSTGGQHKHRKQRKQFQGVWSEMECCCSVVHWTGCLYTLIMRWFTFLISRNWDLGGKASHLSSGSTWPLPSCFSVWWKEEATGLSQLLRCPTLDLWSVCVSLHKYTPYLSKKHKQKKEATDVWDVCHPSPYNCLLIYISHQMSLEPYQFP